MFLITMKTLALLSLVGLVSSRCNNILSSGCGPGNSPYSIFNSVNYGYGQSYVTGASFKCQSRNCLNVDVIPVSLSQISNQPMYTRIVENTPQNRFRDNTCATFFPVPDDDNSYFGYISIVYIDGSNVVKSYLFTQIAPGVFGIANAEYTITQRFFASTEDNLYVTCTRTEFGDNEDFPEMVVISSSPPCPLGLDCVKQLQQVYDCNGVSNCAGSYVLPYRLRPRCYVPQSCSFRNPFTSTF